MWAFFHGWRRKAGVVSLAMACLLASLWIRSINWSDRIPVRTGTDHMLAFQNYPGGIGLCRITDPTGVAIDEYFPIGQWIIWAATPTNITDVGVEDPLFTELMEKKLAWLFIAERD